MTDAATPFGPCPVCLRTIQSVPATCECGARIGYEDDQAATDALPLMPARKVPRLDVHTLQVRFAAAPNGQAEHRPVPTMLIMLEAGEYGAVPITWAVLN